MRVNISAAVFSALTFTTQSPAFSQDDMMSMELPKACQNEFPEGMEMGSMSMQMPMEGMQGHQQSMMQGMMHTMEPMMRGMMAEDPDLAFACGMIPHHQGAIAMAEAELEQGDAKPMRDMAQKIIEAQKREIAELVQWIEEQGQ